MPVSGLLQWIKDLTLLWQRLAAAAPIWRLAWELLHAAHVALKGKKKIYNCWRQFNWCCISHQIAQSMQGQYRHLIISVNLFSVILNWHPCFTNVTSSLDQPTSGLTFQAQILQYINTSIPCLTLSPDYTFSLAEIKFSFFFLIWFNGIFFFFLVFFAFS